jgi:hypothetical protein
MPTFTRGRYPSVRSLRSRFGLACALLLVVVASGCGGSGTLALDPVASAAGRTLDKQTGRFETSIEFGLGHLTGSGTFDASNHDTEMTMTYPGASDAPISMELRMLYPVVYLDLNGLAFGSKLPNGKSWVKVDLRRALDKLGLTLPQLGMGGSQSPVDGLARLRGAKHAKKLGTETIDGTQTTHYRVTVDVKDALAKATPNQREALQRLLRFASQQGVDPASTTSDVWIGGDGLVRRTTERLGGLGSVTTTFSDFGTPVHIEAPPADETVDASALLKNG